ncbi:MAG: N-acetylglucosamine-6-phosphate deacetylase [Bacillota bacterium]
MNKKKHFHTHPIRETARRSLKEGLDRFALYNGTVFTPWASFYGGVVVDRGIIKQIFAGDLPAGIKENGYILLDCHNENIIPGFVDIHVHGAKGFDFTLASEEEIKKAVLFHSAAGGTTSLVPTLVSAPLASLKQAAKRINRANNSLKPGNPQILGVHLEGPFLNPWYKGAHSEEHLRNPEPELIKDLTASIGDLLKLVTLSPELPHALEAIAYLRKQNIAAALGHSGAGVEEVQKAVACGLSHAVHTYSAMRRFHHRSPGVLGAVLTTDALTAEIIADGVHTHPAAVDLFFRAKPKDKAVLVTDALGVCGLSDNECFLGDKKIISREGKAFLENGNIAGSLLTMNRALASAVKMSALSMEEVLPAATINPARVIGADERKGSLEEGKDADIALLDQHYNTLLTICRGIPLTKEEL